MVDVLISPVIYLFEEFLYVIIVTSSNFLLDDFLRACKLEFLMHQLWQGSFNIERQEVFLCDGVCWPLCCRCS